MLLRPSTVGRRPEVATVICFRFRCREEGIARLSVAPAGIAGGRVGGGAGSLGMMTRSAGFVTGAAVWAGLFASIAPAAGFLPAFQAVFHYAGLGFAVFVASTLLRPGLWFRSAER